MKRTGLIVISEEEVKDAIDRVSLLSSQVGNHRIREDNRKPLDNWLKKLLTEIINDPPTLDK